LSCSGGAILIAYRQVRLQAGRILKACGSGGMRLQRNDIEYPVTIATRLTPDDARSAVAVAAEMIDAAEHLLPHLGLFSQSDSRPR